MSTIHHYDAVKLLEKVKVVLNSDILHDDLARDLIETELAITYIDGQQKYLQDKIKEVSNLVRNEKVQSGGR